MDRVNGRVVGIADLLIVTLTERVNGRVVAIGLGLTVTDPDLVPKPDAGTVYGAEGVLVRERVSVTETVRLTDRVKGRVVGIADLLIVTLTERVKLSDTVLEPVTDPDLVPKPDASTV